MATIPNTDTVAAQERIRRLRNGWQRLTNNPLTVLGGLMLLLVIISALFAPILAPYPSAATGEFNFGEKNQPPSLEHPMGTDSLGRDILSRVMFGARISLKIAAIVLMLAVGIGVPLGLIAGYLGGTVNAVIMRAADIFLAIPPILLALAVSTALEPTIENTMIAISVAWWPWYTRLIQGEAISVKEEEFVEASESLGAGWFRVIRKEIFPNVIAPLTVKMTIDAGTVILIGASLAFLGLGVTPPTPSWGVMIAQGRDFVTNFWWMSTFPGLTISFTVIAFNLIGDGLRDYFDVDVHDL